MKTLTEKQPWAYLICKGVKDIENRNWKTNFRGRVLIHASADAKLNLGALTREQYEFCCNNLRPIPALGCDKWDRSAVIGSVEIIDCVKNHPSIWAEKNCWNWVLANPILFRDPIQNIKGKLGFWEYRQETALQK